MALLLASLSNPSKVSLADQLAAKRSSLSSTVTRVRHRDGTLFEERRNQDGTIVTTSAGKEALPAFLSDADAGYSRLQPKIWQQPVATPAVGSDVEAKGRWVGVSDATLPATTTRATTVRPPRIVTYNVWFKEWYQLDRARALFDIVHRCDADVIGFQEVTQPFLSAFIALPWVRDHYIVSDTEGNTIYPYGVLLAVHRRMVTRAEDVLFTLHSLPSNMSRRFLRVCIGHGCGALIPTANVVDDAKKSLPVWAIGTVHLESLANRELRCEQLRVILPLLSPSVAINSCLTGDFNFDDGAKGPLIGGTREPEQAVLDDSKVASPTMVDCWVKLRPAEDGSSGAEQMGRYDRILVRSVGYQPATIEQLGKTPIVNPLTDDVLRGAKPPATTTPETSSAAAAPAVFPSDHWGLFATFAAV